MKEGNQGRTREDGGRERGSSRDRESRDEAKGGTWDLGLSLSSV